MDNLYIEKLRRQVKEALKSDKMRFRHTIGVADTCACMAMRYGVDMQQAYIAGLLHDCAKCVPDEVKIRQCRKYNIYLTDIELKNEYLIHSKLGAFYAKELYGIKDEQICSAIKYHTTAKCDMSMLEKIVFLADYIEPYRNKAKNLEYIRNLAFVDIDKAVYEVLKDTIKYLKQSDRPIDTTTEETFNFYSKIINSTHIEERR
ncbi:MAG: bis(5'-nucleosyl)-tetraphosphatase (symmetrical) YqeK [Eubacteriales bacterium]|nr:bis(5'-nucleosyl)-tetraphosphatase (symmetrical) YqeK [Eubacteriales bacterium]